MDYKTLDSGKRQVFDNGGQRDTQEGKPRYGLIDPAFKKRMAELLARGAEKYDDNNWRKGIKLSRTIESLERHFEAAKEGDETEDHLAAIAVNAMFWAWTLAATRSGLLDPSFNDLAVYLGFEAPALPTPDTSALSADDLARLITEWKPLERYWSDMQWGRNEEGVYYVSARSQITGTKITLFSGGLKEVIQRVENTVTSLRERDFPITPATQHP